MRRRNTDASHGIVPADRDRHGRRSAARAPGRSRRWGDSPLVVPGGTELVNLAVAHAIDVAIVGVLNRNDDFLPSALRELTRITPDVSIVGVFEPSRPSLDEAAALAREIPGMGFVRGPGARLDYLVRRRQAEGKPGDVDPAASRLHGPSAVVRRREGLRPASGAAPVVRVRYSGASQGVGHEPPQPRALVPGSRPLLGRVFPIGLRCGGGRVPASGMWASGARDRAGRGDSHPRRRGESACRAENDSQRASAGSRRAASGRRPRACPCGGGRASDITRSREELRPSGSRTRDVCRNRACWRCRSRGA